MTTCSEMVSSNKVDELNGGKLSSVLKDKNRKHRWKRSNGGNSCCVTAGLDEGEYYWYRRDELSDSWVNATVMSLVRYNVIVIINGAYIALLTWIYCHITQPVYRTTMVL